jgi:hypothetical protein
MLNRLDDFWRDFNTVNRCSSGGVGEFSYLKRHQEIPVSQR